MEITEVKIHLRTREKGKLKAFAAITIDDCFVVKELKVIDGKKGLFVAMPSIKLTQPCPACGKKNALRNKYCVECGKKLDFEVAPMQQHMSEEEMKEEHRDIAHPINAQAREYLQKKVLDAYEHEYARFQASGGSAEGSADTNNTSHDDAEG